MPLQRPIQTITSLHDTFITSMFNKLMGQYTASISLDALNTVNTVKITKWLMGKSHQLHFGPLPGIAVGRFRLFVRCGFSKKLVSHGR